MTKNYKIIAATAADTAAIENLVAVSFGPGRLTRAAERLRECNNPIVSLTHVAVGQNKDKPKNIPKDIQGSIIYFPIRVGAVAGLMLGPLVVAPTQKGGGIGLDLMQHTLQIADTLAQFQFVLLVGDLPYYSRVGFSTAPATVLMAGAVDAARLLVRGNTDIAGKVCAAPDLC